MPNFAVTAYAVDNPYVVIGNNIWLLDRTNGQRIIILPETYYARVDNMDGEYYYVTFNGVAGKVERNSVSLIGYHTEATGTMQEIRIDPKYSYFTEIKLRDSLDGTGEEILVPTDASLVFLGEYPTEADEWYYVGYNGNNGQSAKQTAAHRRQHLLIKFNRCSTISVILFCDYIKTPQTAIAAWGVLFLFLKLPQSLSSAQTTPG